MTSGAELETLRPTLFSLAYRMLGSVAAAEDVVQEAYARHQQAIRRGVAVDSPKAYLSATVTRAAIDELRSARARREVYVGEWLPEPLFTDGGAGDPAVATEQSDSLSLAFLVLLEQLTPVERAVFLLRDVFGYGFDEIAEIVDKSQANCRQLLVRARKHVDDGRPRFDASREERQRLAERFFAAVSDGEVEPLVELLAADVVVYGDSGGTSPSWPRPIYGRDRVGKLLAGIGRQLREHGATLRLQEVNGQPGAVMLTSDEQIISVFAIDVADGVVQTIRSVINPGKLGHLGPLADVRALLRGDR